MDLYDKTVLRIATAVALKCTGDKRPDADDSDPEKAAAYIRSVLKIMFPAPSDGIRVQAGKYPNSNKVPLWFCSKDTVYLFWYYPYVDQVILSGQLAEAISEMFACDRGLTA